MCYLFNWFLSSSNQDTSPIFFVNTNCPVKNWAKNSSHRCSDKNINEWNLKNTAWHKTTSWSWSSSVEDTLDSILEIRSNINFLYRPQNQLVHKSTLLQKFNDIVRFAYETIVILYNLKQKFYSQEVSYWILALVSTWKTYRQTWMTTCTFQNSLHIWTYKQGNNIMSMKHNCCT